ncbi:hypothetical protein [Nonomuraea jabiensis]|uniref:hypothetical protein n=1 Tax=Nonomuraea jabiensis TaxID=882448 RepID=UPI003D710C61
MAGWAGWARSQFFIVCWKRSTLPQVVVGGVLLSHVQAAQFVFEGVAAAAAAARRVAKTMPLSVTVEAGTPWAATAWRKASRTIGPVMCRRQVTRRA